VPTQSLPDSDTRERRLAATYTTTSDATVWELVEQYHHVREYAAEHPQKGSTAVATALELPRSRIRPWLDGSMPDAARAITTAAGKGWLDATPDERVFAGLTVCHAWVTAGGSIAAQTWLPRLVASDGDPERALQAALRAADMQADTQHTASDSRATEYQPSTHGTVLGRVLGGVFGAPVGEKAGTDQQLPDWLRDVPTATQQRWLRTYVSLRGTPINERHGYTVACFAERRPAEWFNGLAELVGDVCGEEAATAGTRGLFLRPDAADALAVAPTGRQAARRQISRCSG
jgi:hypothetical protein